MTMDIAKSFTFMFQDPEWVRKLAIGTIVALVGVILSPILIGLIPLLIILGYSLDVTRNVLDGREYALPEWQDWGGFLARGVKLAVVFIVWALPLILLFIPIGLGSALTDPNNRGGLNAIGGILVTCGSCLGLIWGLVMTLFSPAIYARLARTDRMSSCFEFAEMWAFTRDNLTNVIVAILLTWVAGAIASFIAFVGVLALIIGLIITVPFALLWQVLVQGHLYGQVGAASVAPVDQPSI